MISTHYGFESMFKVIWQADRRRLRHFD